jgi:hypothetical protein
VTTDREKTVAPSPEKIASERSKKMVLLIFCSLVFMSPDLLIS